MLSADYMDGRFFRVTLLTDERFADASLVFGGLHARSDGPEPQVPGALAGRRRAAQSARVRRAATSTGVCGGRHMGRAGPGSADRVALSDPRGRDASSVARHAALLVFCATTYALAPVAGFGWLIATMGLAQCRPNQRRLRVAYITVFLLILLYSEIPWTGVLADWTGR